MKAILQHEYGGVDVLKIETIEIPEPKDNEVQIQIHYTAINPADFIIRAGFGKAFIKASFPLQLGFDLSGVVSKVGKDVKRFKVGDEVNSYLNKTGVRGKYSGTFSEFTCAPEDQVAHKPKELGFKLAAAIPVVSLTAYQFVNEFAKLKEGEVACLVGASGGVGSFSTQFAKMAKAKEVICICSTKNHEYMKKLGATVCIDYKTDYVEAIKKLYPKGVDIVYDHFTKTHEQLEKYVPIVRDGGRIATLSNFMFKTPDNITFIPIQVQARGEELELINKMMARKEIECFVSKEWKFDQIKDAFAGIESTHTRGKMIISVKGGTMKTIIQNEYGGIDKLIYDEIEIPTPKEDELLVKIEYTSMNPIDYKLGNGWFKAMVKEEFPFSLGNDLSGIVVKLGKAVEGFKEGDRVAGYLSRPILDKFGTFGEFTVIKCTQCCLIPGNVPFEVAAAVPVVAQTGYQLVNEIAQQKIGDVVAIIGASGGVGTFTTQFARMAGAKEVICICSAKNHEYMKKLGATVCIDYKLDVVKEIQKLFKDGVDVLYDHFTRNSKDLEKYVSIVKDGGRCHTISNFEYKPSGDKFTFSPFMVQSRGTDLDICLNFISDGRLKVPISKEWKWNEIKEATKEIKAGHTKGKMIFRIPEVKKMKAIVQREYGGMDKYLYEEIDMPLYPAEDDVVVRILYTSLNPIDYKLRNGWFRMMQKETFPFCLGNDLSGYVVKVGSNVKNLKEGDKIAGFLQRPILNHFGTFCEYTVLKASQCALIPEGISFETAAAIPVVAETAYQFVNTIAQQKTGDVVLLIGASGGVGTFTCQFARMAGAKEIICVCSERNHSYMRQLGATICIDYKKDVVKEVQALYKEGVDVLYDHYTSKAEELEKYTKLVKDGGKCHTICNFVYKPSDKRIIFSPFSVQSRGDHLELCMNNIREGKLRCFISKEWKWNQIKEATGEMEKHHTKGKMIFRIPEVEKMNAIIQNEYGGMDKYLYSEIEKPLYPAEEELVVKIHYTSLNPVDYKIRNGWFKAMMKEEFPFCLGNDLSGTVVKVGGNVNKFKVGDLVAGFLQRNLLTKFGTFCEYTVIPASQCALIPKGVSMATAAAIPVVAETAYQLVNTIAKQKKGDIVVLIGASGGVGSFTTQFARIGEAKEIICVCSTRNHARMKELGATICIDYKKDVVKEVLKEFKDGVDILYDHYTQKAEDLEKLTKMVKDGGKCHSICNFVFKPSDKRITFSPFSVQSIGNQLELCLKYLRDKKLKCLISRKWNWNQIKESNTAIESGHTKGKMVMKLINDDSVQAAVLEKFGAPLVVKDLTNRKLIEGSVRVKTLYAGVGNGDIMISSGKSPLKLKPPFVMGAGCIGIVDKMSKSVYGLKEGQLVYCSEFYRPKTNNFDWNEPGAGLLIGYFPISPHAGNLMELYSNGSFSEKVLYPSSCVFPLPEQLMKMSKRSLYYLRYLCISMGAINAGGVKTGDVLLVNGASGRQGTAAVKLGLAMGCKTIYAVGRNIKKLREIYRGIEGANRIKFVTKDDGLPSKCVDVVIDFIGFVMDGNLVSRNIKTLKYGGTMVIAGGCLVNYSVSYLDLIVNELTITSSTMYSPKDVKDVIRLIELGRLNVGNLEGKEFRLNEVNEAIIEAAKDSTKFIGISFD